MTTHLVAFATPNMEQSMRLCVNSAYEYGVDHTWPWFQATLKRTSFYEQNQALLDQPKGAGFWAWKPFIIDWHLRQLLNNEILVYADAGVEFIAPVSHIISCMDQDIFLFGNNWEHAHWCKRDVVEEMWPFGFLDALPKDHRYIQEKTWERFGKQVQASVIFFRVSDYTRHFVKEWLDWCLFEGGRLIDDSPSRLPNHPEFREHRHDQAILTTMAYREGIKLHAWPAVYNRFLGQEFVYSRESYPETDNYPSLFHHHRLRNSEFEALGVKV